MRVLPFREGYFPWTGADLKDWFEDLKGEIAPDLILTHSRDDLHQDHQTVASLTWNTFRRHLIFEYEIPKYDGDRPAVNTFVPLEIEEVEAKVDALLRHFPSQHGRSWFNPHTFRGLCALRGVEAGSDSGFAEAFLARKTTLGLTAPRSSTSTP